MKTENPIHVAIAQNFDNIRRIIENRAYDELNPLLAEQRILIGNLPLADPEAQEYFFQAQDLTAWSLTMVKMERSALATAISDVNRLKQLQQSYNCAEVTDYFDCHV